MKSMSKQSGNGAWGLGNGGSFHVRSLASDLDKQHPPFAISHSLVAIFGFLALALLAGCHSDMYDQPRGKPLAQSHFFQNGQVARPLVDGTVSHSDAADDELLLTGKQNGQLSNTFPFRVTKEVLDRGHERYNVYCSPCHGL